MHTSPEPSTFFFKLELFLQYLSILSLPKRKLCKLCMRMVNDTKQAFPMVQTVFMFTFNVRTKYVDNFFSKTSFYRAFLTSLFSLIKKIFHVKKQHHTAVIYSFIHIFSDWYSPVYQLAHNACLFQTPLPSPIQEASN